MMKKVIKKIKAHATKKTTAAKAKKDAVAKNKIVEVSKKSKIIRKKTTKRVSIEDLTAMIGGEAFRLYEQRGYVHGNDVADWVQAEKNVLATMKK
ncbi:MAG: DUF2934 domain-containing protein [Candidatus Omnitrophica bacterium]|nr:DUF2934 domain-containing protein [Candidatus Omnitrophota bacterium]